MRKRFLQLSLILLILSLFVLLFDYFFYHYFGDEGFSSIFYDVAQKPFVSDLIGQLGILSLFTSLLSLIVAFVFFEKE